MLTFNLLQSKDQTGKGMYRMIDQYHSDLDFIFYRGKKLKDMKLFEFFDFVKNIPYRRDVRGIEVISRPAKIIESKDLGMDCKKKAILIGAYLKNRNIPYRLMSSSKRPDRKIHHVYPQAQIDGIWYNLDATYNHYKPLELKTCTKKELLSK
jgi:hypothetical protein